MPNDKHISKPPLKDGFTVLCIDGTDSHDSISFLRLIKWAGRKKGFYVRNLLEHLPPFGPGKEKEDRKSYGDISSPASGINRTLETEFDPVTSSEKEIELFPFKTHKLANLPMKFVCRQLAYKTFPKGSRCDFVLLPQGEVKGKRNNFNDGLLGPDAQTRQKAARDNSALGEYFALAPGVSEAGSASAHLDFARAGNKNKSTDFLYLSGHGGKSGDIVGEQPHYLMFFSVLNLARKQFLKIGRTSLISPLWIVLASCFSLRKVHCQIWARYFREQNIPIRGILGYRRTSPLAENCVTLNERFAWNLSKGKAFVESWKLAHDRNGLRDRWTALAFDFSKDDTIESLYEFKQNRTPPVSKEKENLFFYFGKKRGKGGGPEKIEILPPECLMEMHNWKREHGQWIWKKFLITNIDFTESSFDLYKAKNPTSKSVNNESWRHCAKVSRMIDMDANLWGFYPFFPNEIYQIGIYPPFNQYFDRGFKNDDEIDFTIVHVRRDYSESVNFSDIFEILLVNSQPATNRNHSIVTGKDSGKKDTIRIKAPANAPFSPVKFSVRFKSKKPKGYYLWFWFGSAIRRGETDVFRSDFDSFTVSYENNDNYYRPSPRRPGDPLPTQ